ncbi:MAG TPA: lysoplasmalogenase [Acidimicrobiales bacterium]
MALAFALAAVLALVDWVGVIRVDRRFRWIGKPGVMLALIAAALLADSAPSAVRVWFVAALVLSLIGDVALLLPEHWFVVGLGAFLLAHLAYIGGMVQLDLEWAWGALLVVLGAALLGPIIVRAVKAGHPSLLAPVVVYLVVISAMAITAWCTHEAWLIVAAMLFFASDAMLGWGRFVTPTRPGGTPARPWGGALAVMVTYHGAQACFVAWLATR